jgi:hypothetical protein
MRFKKSLHKIGAIDPAGEALDLSNTASLQDAVPDDYDAGDDADRDDSKRLYEPRASSRKTGR